MILYHIAFSLFFFGNLAIPIFHWSWEILQTLVAGAFLLLVGISLRLKWKSLTAQRSGEKMLLLGFFTRSAKILLGALLITAVTWISLPEFYVRFGVLHLIALSTVLSIPLLGRPRTALLLGYMIFLLDTISWPKVGNGNVLLTVLGFPPDRFQSLDYFPVIPWFGLVAIGIGIEPFVRFQLSRDRVPTLTWIGRHSLALYLLHQPVILLGMSLLNFWR